MLPEFPKARRAMNEMWNKALFTALHHGDPLVAGIQVRVQKEGHAAAIGAEDIKYEKHSVTFSFPTRDAQGMTPDEFFGMASKLGMEMAGEQAKTLIEALRNPSPYGQPFEWKKGELRFEQILDVWRKMEARFGDDGKPIWPTMLLPPEARAELEQKLPQWLNDPECQRMWAELITVKRKEFDEREARRRLVD
jgi:hypothetical protein